MIQWHKNDMKNRMYINVGDGKKAAMPRYYKNKIYTDQERSEISGFQKGEMEKRQLEALESEINNPGYNRQVNQAKLAAFKSFNHRAQEGRTKI